MSQRLGFRGPGYWLNRLIVAVVCLGLGQASAQAVSVEFSGNNAEATLSTWFKKPPAEREADGSILLEGKSGITFELINPAQSIDVVISDPQRDSTFMLQAYAGTRLLESASSASSKPGQDIVQLALTAKDGFDRVVVREVSGRLVDSPDYLLRMELTPAFAAKSMNDDAIACQLPLGLVYNVAFGVALVPSGFGLDIIADGVAYASNLGLKFCKTAFEPPTEKTIRGNIGDCTVEVPQHRMVGEYENALGLQFGNGPHWGVLGKPTVFHHNTEVVVTVLHNNAAPPAVDSLGLGALLSVGSLEATDQIYKECDDDNGTVRYSQLEPGGTQYECPYVANRKLEFDVGYNTVRWRSEVRISPLDMLSPWIPGVPSGAKFEPFRSITLRAIRDLLLTGLDTVVRGWRFGNTHEANQLVTILDEVPPVIEADPVAAPRITTQLVGEQIHVLIEADEVGGVSTSRYIEALRGMYDVQDACDRPTTLSASYPEPGLVTFWPISTVDQDNSFFLTWIARDPGPNLNGLPNSDITAMRVEVVDTQPPVIVPPPDIVEVDSGEVSELGQPLVFDYVDLAPNIEHDASLPLGLGLHQVTWTATDASGNSEIAVQIVNIKSSNIEPVALEIIDDDRAQAISFEPTTIRLEGDDMDGDPLTFYIEETPAEGFFEAPLYPYFVEDFRMEQSITDDGLVAICENGQGSDRNFDLDFISEPSYISVVDDGRWFVVDRGYIDCRAGSPVTANRLRRLAIFDHDSTLIGSVQLNQTDHLKDIVVDLNADRVYLASFSGSGRSTVSVYDFDLDRQVSFQLWNLQERGQGGCDGFGPDSNCDIDLAVSAVIDGNDILYVMDDSGAVYALDGTINGSPTQRPDFISMLADDGLRPDSGRSLELGPGGDVYASRNGRLYKFSASTVVDTLAYPGPLHGWLGRCDTDLAVGDQAVCDVTNHRSLGFSCTNDTCGNEVASTPGEMTYCDTHLNFGELAGCRPGQFRGIGGIAVDPEGTIYAADAGNLRVQRFTADGFFAGEARSSCDGSCFILGDFGRARDVSVNSSRFYVLDPDSNLLHISLATPFTDLGSNYAELKYQSNNDFACADSSNCIDSFAFSVSDGVYDDATGRPLRSAAALVEVEVSRNFRPPIATPGIAALVAEDTLTAITLDGSDPDPLDTLSFVVTQQPNHGSVTVSGSTANYLPDTDYVGDDAFEFAAFDGIDQSAAEPVALFVENRNDFPAIGEMDPITAGLGFRLEFATDFTDPDVDDIHLLTVSWGDGTIESEGEIDMSGQITGPLLVETNFGIGRLSGSHVYTALGPRILQLCVSDQIIVDDDGNKMIDPVNSLTSCSNTTVNVIEAVDLAINAATSTERLLAGETIEYDIELKNLEPEAGVGVFATGVAAKVELDTAFDPSSIAVSGSAGCQISGRVVDCNFGALAAGSIRQVQVSATLPVDAEAGELLLTEVTAELNETDLSPQNQVVISTPVVIEADFYVSGVTPESLADESDANPGDGQCATDQGVCTLRAAVQEANAAAGHQSISLGQGVFALNDGQPLFVNDDLTINGLGPDQSFIGGDGSNSLIYGNGGSLTLQSLTLSGSGGTAVLATSDLTVDTVRFTGNSDTTSFGNSIQAIGNTIIRNTTFDNNHSANDAALWAFSSSTVLLENVTFVGNTGGAVSFAGGTHTIVHSTLSGNSGGSGWAGQGAALSLYDGAQVTIVNSVLTDNYPIADGPINCATFDGSSLISDGGNFFGDITGCSTQTDPSDVIGGNSGLRPARPGANGQLIVPFGSTSPLVDAAVTAPCLGHDAAGSARPLDGNSDGLALCDIGAFEFDHDPIFKSGFQ
ncbi:MAG: hypothetical protein DHS20C11_34690 [Lysobacteraceae bacterium]|nr:MAG: hypothetical protein DHS20C11_34690 [Xanthomonadaceae bacterium]